MFEFILLGYLMICPMNGYQIKQFIRMSMTNFMDASFGSIYPTLKKLKEKGMVSSEDVVEGGKLTKVYTIEKKGRRAFEEWLGEPVSVGKAKQWHLVKLFFFDVLDVESRKEHFEFFINDAQQQLDHLDQIAEGTCEDKSRYHLATLEFGRRYYAMVKDFYRELLGSADGNSMN